MNNQQKIPEQPLQKIGLSCSGGGYRAAGFHLGTMSYLNHLEYDDKPLLENVKMISTVSGGTITGIIYALRKQRGESFKDIYDFILDKLKKLDLVNDGIQKLNPGAAWNNPFKRKNFINAFAELYDQHFTEGKTFAEFSTMNSHLENVVFNSTEFNNGIDFRFRNPSQFLLFGNSKIKVLSPVREEVKLSDAMAASSCFTGGFEPMVWPQDFIHPAAENLKKMSANASVGIMDGGIYDNQGVECLLNYKSANTPYFDLVIVSDVTSPYMQNYQPVNSVADTSLSRLTINRISQKFNRISNWVGAALALLTVFFASLPFITDHQYGNNLLTGISVTLFFVFLFLLIIKVLLVRKIRSVLTEILSLARSKLGDYFSTRFAKLKIGELPLGKIIPLVMDRAKSLYTLFMDVFLKVVRRLNYAKLYDDERYTFRRITTLIHEMTKEDFDAKVGKKTIATATAVTAPSTQPQDPEDEKHDVKQTIATATDPVPFVSHIRGSYDEVVGKNIQPIAEQVASFGTTLWFTDQNQLDSTLDKLVASGQFTMCYNMIEYLELIMFTSNNGYNELPAPTQEKIKKLYDGCCADWDRFKATPNFMV